MSIPVLPTSVEVAFPAASKTFVIEVASRTTNISYLSFTDKIFISITQTGTFAHWVHVSLFGASDPMQTGRLDSHDRENMLLPSPYLTATTVLGGTKPDAEVFGQTLATTLASSILVKRPEEDRTLVLGLGFQEEVMGRTAFDEILAALLDFI